MAELFSLNTIKEITVFLENGNTHTFKHNFEDYGHTETGCREILFKFMTVANKQTDNAIISGVVSERGRIITAIDLKKQ